MKKLFKISKTIARCRTAAEELHADYTKKRRAVRVIVKTANRRRRRMAQKMQTLHRELGRARKAFR